MCYLYDTFYISLLDSVKSTPIPPHKHSTIPPTAYIKNDQEYFEVEDILDLRCTKNWLEYLIKWKGYPGPDNS